MVATDPRITGFDANAVREGIRLAMQVGLPVMVQDQPTFFMPTHVADDGQHALDQGGLSFLPQHRPARTQASGIRVPCAVEYKDAAGTLEAPGLVSPTAVVLTLLDEDYAQIKGFAYVVIAGIRYSYQHVEKPNGLVSVGVYTIHCLSDDEG